MWSPLHSITGLPLVGHPKLGKGLADLGAMWLTGKDEVIDFFKETDRILKGRPVRISSLKDNGIFRSVLRNQIVKYGKRIIDPVRKTEDTIYTNFERINHDNNQLSNGVDASFNDAIIKEGNLEINEVVRQYALDEFAKFTSGGTSHIDFIGGSLSAAHLGEPRLRRGSELLPPIVGHASGRSAVADCNSPAPKSFGVGSNSRTIRSPCLRPENRDRQVGFNGSQAGIFNSLIV